MTGAYLRVKREGKWVPLEVEYLTPEERRTLLQDRNMAEVMNWMDVVCENLVRAETSLITEGVIGGPE